MLLIIISSSRFSYDTCYCSTHSKCSWKCLPQFVVASAGSSRLCQQRDAECEHQQNRARKSTMAIIVFLWSLRQLHATTIVRALMIPFLQDELILQTMHDYHPRNLEIANGCSCVSSSSSRGRLATNGSGTPNPTHEENFPNFLSASFGACGSSRTRWRQTRLAAVDDYYTGSKLQSQVWQIATPENGWWRPTWNCGRRRTPSMGREPDVLEVSCWGRVCQVKATANRVDRPLGLRPLQCLSLAFDRGSHYSSCKLHSVIPHGCGISRIGIGGLFRFLYFEIWISILILNLIISKKIKYHVIIKQYENIFCGISAIMARSLLL